MKKITVISAKRLAFAAMFSALAFVLTFLEFPIFPAASYLKLDFSFAVLLIGSFVLGAPLGAVMIVITELLCMVKSSSGYVGELANIILGACFILIPVIMYKYKKTFATALIGIIIGSVLQTAASLLCNRFIFLPLYMGSGAEEAFKEFWVYILLFNIIKCAANGIITVILYKRTSKLLHKII